ncbi:hypothetical protein EMO89_00370 [Bifidobacterium tissieri]|uniref:Uncharacterized protein n=1 Tax=Bifidobacterium tissieri TaxID=1630162 RepID=A0A5M9ZWX1_9BIFI|nr:hypothetical protein [Bifidobacterium tissieri]KAA8832018.1 hypothetical protein EMO89_00370 [Bifidobacterium tissieri]
MLVLGDVYSTGFAAGQAVGGALVNGVLLVVAVLLARWLWGRVESKYELDDRPWGVVFAVVAVLVTLYEALCVGGIIAALTTVWLGRLAGLVAVLVLAWRVLTRRTVLLSWLTGADCQWVADSARAGLGSFLDKVSGKLDGDKNDDGGQGR